jgi:hypothetical protein
VGVPAEGASASITVSEGFASLVFMATKAPRRSCSRITAATRFRVILSLKKERCQRLFDLDWGPWQWPPFLL